MQISRHDIRLKVYSRFAITNSSVTFIVILGLNEIKFNTLV